MLLRFNPLFFPKSNENWVWLFWVSGYSHNLFYGLLLFCNLFEMHFLLAYFRSHILQPSVCICWLLGKIKEALKIDGIVFQLDEITIKKLLHKASLYKVHLFLYLHFLAKWRAVARQKKGGLGGGTQFYEAEPAFGVSAWKKLHTSLQFHQHAQL